VQNYRNALRRFLSFVDRTFDTRHADRVPRVVRALPRARVCTDEEFQRLYLLAQPWMRFLLLLWRTLGLRHEEAAALTPRNFNPDTNTLHFDRKAQGTSSLPVTDELGNLIRFAATIDPDAPVVKSLGLSSIPKYAVGQAWETLRRRAGVAPDLIIHDLRRTAITAAYEKTKDLRIAQKLAGHRTPASTLHYLSSLGTPDDLRTVVREITPATLDAIPLASERTQ
jgi:integrase